MMNQKYPKYQKECPQCGEHFEEEVKSAIAECTKCFGKHNE
ncbi:MAG TPA: YhfH family protein [Bacillota bacterium]|nr:YhfH family protein [Bacillota bacterium]